MKKIRSKFIDNKSGELTIETMLVMFPIICVLLFLLSLGFLLYQHWNMQIAVDDAVSKIAGTYSVIESDNQTGVVSNENYREVELYRNIDIFGGATKYENKNKERLTEYLTDRLNRTSFANQVGETEIVSEIVSDAFARKHLKVTATAEFRIPFGEGLELMGMNATRSYTATASAECMDMLDYVNSVKVVEVAPDYIDSKFLDAVDSWMKLIVSVINFGK